MCQVSTTSCIPAVVHHAAGTAEAPEQQEHTDAQEHTAIIAIFQLINQLREARITVAACCANYQLCPAVNSQPTFTCLHHHHRTLTWPLACMLQ